MQYLLFRQRFHAGELFAFEELEAGAAAGADVGDLVGHAGLVDGAHRVATADDADGAGVGNRVGDGVGAHGKLREFKDARGAVPDNGLGGLDDSFNGRHRLGTDVQTLPVGGEVHAGVPLLGVGFGREVVGKDVIDGEQ